MSLKAKHEFRAVAEGQDVTTSSAPKTVVCFAWEVSCVKFQTWVISASAQMVVERQTRVWEAGCRAGVPGDSGATLLLYNCLKGGCRQVGVSLFFKGTRGNGLKVCKVGFRFDVRKNFFA